MSVYDSVNRIIIVTGFGVACLAPDDSHRRLWWRRAVVAAAFIFPRPGQLIIDFIEFYNFYITI